MAGDTYVNLYIYCVNSSAMRIGDSGAIYFKLAEEKQSKFEEVIETYIDIKCFIWDWEEYEDN